MAQASDGKRLTHDDKMSIKRRYEAGESLSAIGRDMGRNHSTILYHIQKMGLKMKRETPKCAVGYCKLKQHQKGFCRKHNNHIGVYEPLHKKKQPYAEDLNNLIPLRDYKSFEEKPPVEPPCDHTRSSCDCLNRGKYYKEYKKDNR